MSWSFRNTDQANIKIVVSEKFLKINEVMDNDKNPVSAEQAEIILRYLNHNIDFLSTKNFDLKFE